MDINEARAAVSYAARELATALDAYDSAGPRLEKARQAALAAAEHLNTARADLDRYKALFDEAEAVLYALLQSAAINNGQGSGSAENPTIRIDYPDQ